MVTRAQIERLSERVEKIATAGDKQLIVVVEPSETNEQALRAMAFPRQSVLDPISSFTPEFPGRGDKIPDREMVSTPTSPIRAVAGRQTASQGDSGRRCGGGRRAPRLAGRRP
jgi:hypothetical protein